MAGNTNAGKKRVQFEVQAEPGSHVFVTGTFNDWDPVGKRMLDKTGEGRFKAGLMLAPGTYEYKFVINGVWCVDPDCPDWAHNDLGSLNSVVTVNT
jgi:1,4-alpha-glucan branching enzyme